MLCRVRNESTTNNHSFINMIFSILSDLGSLLSGLAAIFAIASPFFKKP